MRWIVIISLLSVALVSCSVWADRVVLTDGTEILGTVTRVIIGDSIEVLRVNLEAGEARLDSFDLDYVASVEIENVSRIPFTLVLKAGDYVSGTLLGSPLKETIDFRTIDGPVLKFNADAVSEIRLGVRKPGRATSELIPAFGFGLSFSTSGVGITQDAIAWFNEDWMLVASLGLRGWWQDKQFSLGIANELTYLRKIGKLYLGIGTGAFYNMTTLSWGASLNVRVVVPIEVFGQQSFLSIGLSWPQY